MNSRGSMERETVANSELLYKQQTRFGQTYKQYFFRFVKPPASGGCYALQYSHRNKLAEIKLDNVLSVDSRHAKSQDYAFVIHCLDSKYQFACTSLNDMERWLGTLRKELLAAPVVAKPGKDVVGVEIDPTALSRHLQLGGLYLLEVTQSDIILWLPRSRKETIRWSLGCIHSLDHLKPQGAQLQSIIIELNELSATGQGTLIFKTEDGQDLVDLVEKYTGKKVQGLAATLQNRKSVRKRTSSQENLRNMRGMDPIFEGSSRTVPGMPSSALRRRGSGGRKGSGSFRRYGSESFFSDHRSAGIPPLPRRPDEPLGAQQRTDGLKPVMLPATFGQAGSPPTSHSPSSPRARKAVQLGFSLSVSPPAANTTTRDITNECSSIPPLPPRNPDRSLSLSSTASAGSGSAFGMIEPDECPTPPSARMGRYGSWDGGSESSGLSPMGLSSGTPPINRCASPIFPPLQNPPSLPPRPASPSPQRANTNLPPAIPPRPDLCATDSVNGRGPQGIATLATSPLRSLPSHMPPPVSPRSAASLPVNHSSIHGGSSPLFPRQSYENTNLPSRLR
ncbi:uncharacterized protein LOC135815578 [Sycon ciliatum]|uniref:uncharacterized protein LOC135815578 n=1 Tax=Sycon ciliatum TaxID=27933 RepID=UPI0031F67B13